MADRGGHGVYVAGRAGHRLGDHAALGVIDAGREVAGFAGDGAEGRAQQRLRLFLDDGDQAVPHDLGADGARGHRLDHWPVTVLAPARCSRELLIARAEVGADDRRGLVLGDDGRPLDDAPGAMSKRQIDRRRRPACQAPDHRRCAWRAAWRDRSAVTRLGRRGLARRRGDGDRPGDRFGLLPANGQPVDLLDRAARIRP